MSSAGRLNALVVQGDEEPRLEELAAQVIEFALTVNAVAPNHHVTARRHDAAVQTAIFPAILAFISRDNASMRLALQESQAENAALLNEVQAFRAANHEREQREANLRRHFIQPRHSAWLRGWDGWRVQGGGPAERQLDADVRAYFESLLHGHP